MEPGNQEERSQKEMEGRRREKTQGNLAPELENQAGLEEAVVADAGEAGEEALEVANC